MFFEGKPALTRAFLASSRNPSTATFLASSMVQKVFMFFLKIGVKDGPSNPQPAVGSGKILSMVMAASLFSAVATYVTTLKEFLELSNARRIFLAISSLLSWWHKVSRKYPSS